MDSRMMFFPENMLMSRILCHITPRQFIARRLIANSSIHRAEMKTPIQQWGWAYLQRQKALGRPISPHLTVYQPQLTWMVSGLHRVTGCVMAGVLLFGGVGFATLPFNFTEFVEYIRSWHIPAFVIAFPIIFHTLNGIRFIGFDLAKGLENTKAGMNNYVENTPDFEEPRLAVEGFVVCRLLYIVPPRKVAHIFERRHRIELHDFADELLENENLTFSRYCEIVDEFGRTADEMENGMSYGRLAGLISFGGLVAARLYACNLRREVQQIATYTSKFIDKRIRLTWVEDERSWKNFMLIGGDIVRRDAVQREAAERRRSSRRWSLIGIGAAALFGVGAIIGTRVLLGAK
ncbi:putative succinate dehydrogenase, cytochrome b556 subunit [Dictyocaulus viviparus]|uniref:Putative succinate dehydrogenase, cytochrome b556 subunit n=1 Tax=Dictyocaulus viviparus TaxID=29172 RepID=A0A0D8XWC2_DICVI|nr:putative succinate dehydrogenase, cytochrome b556 subunit [Dictyocaulus viviparus]